MNKRIFRAFLPFFILCLLVLLSFGFVSADRLVNNELDAPGFNSGSASRSSNGTLFSLSSGVGSQRHLALNISYDNGDTWPKSVLVDTDAAYVFTYPTVAVDSSDNVYVFYADRSGDPGGAAQVLLKIYNVTGGLQSTTQIHDWTTYTITGAKLVVDHDDNIHVVYSGYHAAATGYVYYKKYNAVLSAWSAEQKVVSGASVKGSICLDMDVDYYSGSCSPYVFYNNLTTGGTVCKVGVSWDAVSEYTIATETARIADFKVAYSNCQNRIVFVYDDPDDYSIDWCYLYLPTMTVSSMRNAYTDPSYDQIDVALSITSNDVVNFFWCGQSPDSASSKIRYRSYSLISGDYLNSAGYSTIGGDTHNEPFVVNSMYPNFCKLTNNYLLFYYNDTDDDVVFDSDTNPVWLSGGDVNYSASGNLYFRFFEYNTKERLGFYASNFTGTVSEDSWIDGRITVNGTEIHYTDDHFTVSEYVHGVIAFTSNGTYNIDVTGLVTNLIHGGYNNFYCTYDAYDDDFVLHDGVLIDVYLNKSGTPQIDDYDDLYGSFYIEFRDQVQCDYYSEDDDYFSPVHPVIVYNVDDSNFSDAYGYIYKIITDDNFTVYTGEIYFVSGSDSAIFTVGDFYFPEAGWYHIRLYNVSSNGLVDSVVYRSGSIFVCGGSYRGTADATSYDYTAFIGFMVCICVGAFAGFLTMSGVAFGFGFLGSLIVFSIPNTPYVFFPTIVLFLAGLVLVLMFFYMLRRA